jgi:hypothetical protein
MGVLLYLGLGGKDGARPKAALQTTNLPPLRIGEDFWTGNLQLKLDCDVGKGSLAVSFDAQAFYRPGKDQLPLEFHVGAAIGSDAFTLSGSMSGYWRNPFGLCSELVLGPDLIIQLEVLYGAETPKRFAFVGEACIGKVRGRLDLQIAADPRQQVISAEFENLALSDVVLLLADEGEGVVVQVVRPSRVKCESMRSSADEATPHSA